MSIIIKSQTIYGAPSIVTDGLSLYLDAANTRSYPGSGTAWYDLSGNVNHGTLVNGPTFDSGNAGSIVFDGTNKYVNFPNPLNQTQLDQIWTVQSWINITTAPYQILVGGLNSDLFIEYVQGNNSLLYLNGSPNDYYTYGGQFTSQGWVLATFRFNNSTGDRQILRNNTNISTTGPNQTSTPSGQLSTFTLSSSNNAINGKVANLFIYDRYLSDEEILQNYNVIKNRYS
mgnify:CR=1 FL=1